MKKIEPLLEVDKLFRNYDNTEIIVLMIDKINEIIELINKSVDEEIKPIL